MPVCAAYGCSNRPERDRKKGISFHMFPKKEDLRQKWVQAVRRKDFSPRPWSILCSEHFSEEAKDRTSHFKDRLREGAVPTIFNASCKKSELRVLRKNRKVPQEQDAKTGSVSNPSLEAPSRGTKAVPSTLDTSCEKKVLRKNRKVPEEQHVEDDFVPDSSSETLNPGMRDVPNISCENSNLKPVGKNSQEAGCVADSSLEVNAPGPSFETSVSDQSFDNTFSDASLDNSNSDPSFENSVSSTRFETSLSGTTFRATIPTPTLKPTSTIPNTNYDTSQNYILKCKIDVLGDHIKKYRKKIKVLLQSNRRLVRKNESLKGVISDMKKQNCGCIRRRAAQMKIEIPLVYDGEDDSEFVGRVVQIENGDD